jgi:hypothetical protein
MYLIVSAIIWFKVHIVDEIFRGKKPKRKPGVPAVL